MDKQSVAQKKYVQIHYVRKILINFFRIFIFIAFVFIWEIAAKIGYIDDFIFSSPSRIFSTTKMLLEDNSLYYHLWVTIYETLISFGLVTLISIVAAVILWFSKMASEIFEPYLVVLNSLPKSALAPVLIVWLGANERTIIITAISVAVFGTIISVYTGFSEVDLDKIKLIKTLGGKNHQVMSKVIIPSTIPIIISSMKVNIGLALVGVIIGEFLAAKAGLGYLIIYGSQVFKMDLVLMSIVLLCVLAAVLYLTLAGVQKIYDKLLRR